ncbi:hypothetical protein [Glycomyces arizonensis]|uniref:hypothetical protein n=1 Tax=Glycomyces arizonensis TaxID=256035 RepID=UPI0012EB3C23|nr:hypothetical protein [Glycomyces arizonensis]
MSQPPNYGGPPSGPDPQHPYGQGPGQPPSEGGGPPQYPSPGQGPGQPPPGGVPPPWPPPSTGSGYTGAQGGYPYQFGPPGPPPRKHRTGLIAGLSVAGAVVVIAAAVLIFMNLRGDDEPEQGAIEETSEQVTEEPTTAPEETTGPPTIDEAVGLCLPYEPQIVGYSFDLTTSCDGEQAFWQITAVSDDTGATVDDEGMLADVQAAYDVCGEEYGAFQLGELWKDWYFTYDEATGGVEELYCVEAIGNADSEGRTPVTPDTGSCFDDSDTWWSVPCDSDLALYEVVDTVAVDPPEEMTTDEANDASAPCSGGEFFWQVTDVENRTTSILCGNGL